jgi:hypothetical protein
MSWTPEKVVSLLKSVDKEGDQDNDIRVDKLKQVLAGIKESQEQDLSQLSGIVEKLADAARDGESYYILSKSDHFSPANTHAYHRIMENSPGRLGTSGLCPLYGSCCRLGASSKQANLTPGWKCLCRLRYVILSPLPGC